MNFIKFFEDRFLQKFSSLFKKQPKYILNLKYHSQYISFNEFKTNKIQILSNILDDFSKEKYYPDPLHPILIPKSDGSFRLICIPSIKDRLVQKIVLEYIKEHHTSKYRLATDHDFSSKRENGGAIQARILALELRNKHSHVLKTDISSFFDNLNRKLIKENVCTQINIKEITFILKKVVDMDIKIPSITSFDANEIKFLNSKKGTGIRQGMPMSSFLASLYLYDFDNFMSNSGIKYVRYADDLIVFSQSYRNAKQILDLIKVELAKIGLTVPPLEEKTKTKIVNNRPIDFLGLDFVYTGKLFRSYIPNSTFEKIATKLSNYDSLNKNLKNKKNFADVIQDINYINNGYQAAFSDACNISQLTLEINEKKINVFSKLMTSIGVDIHSLSARQKRFFFNI